MRPIDYVKWRLNKNHRMLGNVLIIFVMTLVANLFSSVFFFYLGRRLGPEQYGEFGSLMALFFSFYFITTVVGVIIIRYISYFQAKSQQGKIAALIVASKRRWFTVGGILFLLIAVFSYPLSLFLGLGFWDVILAGLTIWAFSLFMNNMSIINGLQKFKVLGWYKVLDSLFTLIMAVILLELLFFKRLGLGVEGALLSIFLSALIVFFLSERTIRPYLNAQKVDLGGLHIKDYIIKSIIFSFSLGLMVNVDVFMVKYLFPRLPAVMMANPEAQVGFYAAASVIAKSVFFISLGIVTVFFPKVAELHANGKNPIALFRSSIKYVLLSSVPLAILFLLIPNFVSHVLYGPIYQLGSFLGLYSISMALLAVTNIMLSYHLAMKDFRSLPYMVGTTLLVILLISIFHSSSLVVVIDILVSTLLLFLITLYFTKDELREAFWEDRLFRRKTSWWALRR
ncbi:MAG: oligosaccharide flippase family protein [DPANN group archaeon]|nr:oligosaccharide flippase family protein [DPANN group archaeon]